MFSRFAANSIDIAHISMVEWEEKGENGIILVELDI